MTVTVGSRAGNPNPNPNPDPNPNPKPNPNPNLNPCPRTRPLAARSDVGGCSPVWGANLRLQPAHLPLQACSEGETPRHAATEVAKGFFWQTCAS